MLKYFLHLDHLGDEVSLQVNGKPKFKTLVGAILSILIYTLVLTYAAIKYL